MRINPFLVKLYIDNLIHFSMFVHIKHIVSSFKSIFLPSSISPVQILKNYILSKSHFSVNFIQNQILCNAIYSLIRFIFVLIIPFRNFHY